MYSACCSTSPLAVGVQKGHINHDWRKKGKHSARWILLRALIFPYLLPQQGHKQLRILIVGTLPLTDLPLTHSFFQISSFGQVVGRDPTKIIFICKLTWKLSFLRQKVEVFFPSILCTLYGVSWSAAFCPLLSTSGKLQEKRTVKAFMLIFTQ